jgi:hypothetical protein
MRIKAIPIKSETLCKKCYFNVKEHCQGRQDESCIGCPMLIESRFRCTCANIKVGEPCRNFKRKESTLPTKMTPGFFVDKCKCGGNISVQFGFSCTGKPMSTLRCDNCFKSVSIIGFLEHGKQFMDYWEGADNG